MKKTEEDFFLLEEEKLRNSLSRRPWEKEGEGSGKCQNPWSSAAFPTLWLAQNGRGEEP